MSGMGFLIRMRGPKRHRPLLAKAVLEAYSDSSVGVMMHTIRLIADFHER